MEATQLEICISLIFRPETDNLFVGMLVIKLHKFVERFQGKVHPGENMVMGIGAGLMCGLEQKQLCLKLGNCAPSDIYPIIQDEQSSFFDRNGRKVLDFGVKMQVKITSLIIQQRNQMLQDGKFVVRDDEPGVTHKP